jgi:hypothetical protein
VAKTRTRIRPRGQRGALGAGLATVNGLFGAAFVALFKLLTPLYLLAAAGAAAAWRSRAARRGAGVVFGAAICTVMAWVMLNHLRTSERFQIDPGRIELAATPSWAKPELAARVKSEIETPLRKELAAEPATDAFDVDLAQKLASALQRSPWVRAVVRVERRFPADVDGASSLQPVLEVRRPALLVECSDGNILVDGEAVVLPLAVGKSAADVAAFSEQLAAPVRVVRGVRGRAPKPGEIWRSEQVAAALSMEVVLRESEIDNALPIAAIELIGVPDKRDSKGRVFYPDDGCVMLWPDQQRFPQTCLIWGRPPVHASTLEASPNQKLAQLRRRLEQSPETISGARIDLRDRA